MAAYKHLIKKYTNRKLNDGRVAISLSRGIPQLVLEGHDIHVVDRDSGRDLTPLILCQIVIGEEKGTGTDCAGDTLKE